jgi:hypothetical protein
LPDDVEDGAFCFWIAQELTFYFQTLENSSNFADNLIETNAIFMLIKDKREVEKKGISLIIAIFYGNRKALGEERDAIPIYI